MHLTELVTELRDAIYSIKRYCVTYRKWPNFLYPKTYNEHLLRKKLFDRNPLLTQIADKYTMRAYVTEHVGSEYLTQLYLVTSDPTQIDFQTLPNRFVIKATHGCGYNIFVHDKSTLDPDAAIHQLQEWLSINYYTVGREWCYKHIQPKVIVEELLQDATGKTPTEYKVSCFGGKPYFVAAHIDRAENHRQAFYDLNWRQVPMVYVNQHDILHMPRPTNLDELLAVAEKLSQGLDYVRVDFYNDGQRVIVGELTNYPNNGYSRFVPEKYDHILGEIWRSAQGNLAQRN